jgi:thiol-disulfide isomerase/thioredoxin
MLICRSGIITSGARDRFHRYGEDRRKDNKRQRIIGGVGNITNQIKAMILTFIAGKRAIISVSLVALLVLAASPCAWGMGYSVGSGEDEWWTKYPDQSPAAGEQVNHPSWVLDALRSKPVLIYVHKECDYCRPQTEAANKVAEKLKGKIAYYEILAGGSDSRAEEALKAYDPNGGINYVPMTIILSLAPGSDGEVGPVWHSSEEITGEDWIRTHIEDAISNYDENSLAWKK